MLGSWTALALTDRSSQQMITQHLASLLCFARLPPQEEMKPRRAGSKVLPSQNSRGCRAHRSTGCTASPRRSRHFVLSLERGPERIGSAGVSPILSRVVSSSGYRG